MTVEPFDAFWLVSFGGPEAPEEVVPFLKNVTRGKDIPEERLVEVGEHYFGFGGKSPINDQNRDLMARLQAELERRGIDLPVYWGNRNWDPYLRESAEQMVADGVRRVFCFTTSAYSSYSSCRQYRENLFEASEGLDLELHRARPYFNHPGFVDPFVDATAAAIESAEGDPHVIFVTHSIPHSMNNVSGGPDQKAYERQHESIARYIAERLGGRDWSLAYCSRSGPPQVPWLEPDVNDHMTDLVQQGVESVVVVPIGFISDHMEVIYDLDTEARQTAAELGLEFARVATPDTDERFVDMMIELAAEKAADVRGVEAAVRTVGDFGALSTPCKAGCCANPRAELPAVP